MPYSITVGTAGGGYSFWRPVEKQQDGEGMDFFATTAKGVEDLLAAELQSLGIAAAVVETGGVRFMGDLSVCYRANLWLRTASRVLMPLAGFSCETPQHLYDGVRTIPWHDFITPEMTLAVDCNLRDSTLTHSGFVALKTKDAIVDEIRERCGSRPNVDTRDPDLRVNVHLVKNRCTVSLDTSGTPLDRRGYRLERNEAPLRETLAAALVMLTGWDGTVPLADPMCGSGTIPIEAALIGLRIAPGRARRFAAEDWPTIPRALWEEARQETADLVDPGQILNIRGSDLDPEVLSLAGYHARQAGVNREVVFENLPLADLTLSEPAGCLIGNPPYGERIGDRPAVEEICRQLGRIHRSSPGWSCHILSAHPPFERLFGRRADRRRKLYNGRLECQYYQYFGGVSRSKATK